MNQSLQSYTPLPRPLDYDALNSQEGCQDESGVKQYAAEPFVTLCIAKHNSLSSIFSLSGKISYQVGPATTGEAEPNHNIIWMAWQATVGIRISRFGSVVLPDDTLGAASALFPVIQTTKVTHAFNKLGLLAIAIEKPVEGQFIQLKRYLNADPGTIDDLTFAGYQPLLYNTWNLDKGDAAETGLVLYYLRSNRRSIFARFEQDDFDAEYEVLPDIRVEMASLLKISSVDGKVYIYGRDTFGRDITIKSLLYGQTLGADNSGLAIAMPSGAVSLIAIQVTLDADEAAVGIALDSGSVYDATAEAPNTGTDKASFGFALDSGEITLT